jgi:hypothetical protein
MADSFLRDSVRASGHGLVVDDLIQGMGDWRNIQDIVRLTFRAVNDVLKEQGTRIADLELALADKASRDEMRQSLALKAGVDDVNRTLGEVSATLDGTATADDVGAVQRAVRELGDKLATAEAEAASCRAQLARLEADVGRTKADVSAKAGAPELGRFATKTELAARPSQAEVVQQIEAALAASPGRQEVRELAKQLREQKAERAEALRQAEARLERGIAEVRSRVSEELGAAQQQQQQQRSAGSAVSASWQEELRREASSSTAALAASTESRLAELDVALRQKADAADVQLLLASKLDRMEHMEAAAERVSPAELEARLRSNTEAVAAEVKAALVASQQEIVAVLNQKAYKADVNRSLQLKADSAWAEGALEGKLGTEEAARLLGAKADAAAVERDIAHFAQNVAGKVAGEELAQLRQSVLRLGDDAEAWRGPVEELRKEVVLKVNIKDVCTLLDMKANIGDVNDALESVNVELEAKAPGAIIDRVEGEVRALGQCVREELLLGRWIWKSGRIAGGQTVPWNVQSINTGADNFIWTKNCETILCVAPGLYEVRTSFFTSHSPCVQIMVNGEPVITATESASGKLRPVVCRGRHSAGNVTGLSISEFLALPARAQICVTYDGTDSAQGFLQLRKL